MAKIAARDPAGLDLEAFTLTRGGPLHHVMLRTGLVPPEEIRPWRRLITLMIVTFVPLVALSAMQGVFIGGSLTMPLAYDLTVYARFLVVVPLLIVAERSLEDVGAPFLTQLVNSGLVHEDDVPRLAKATRVVHSLARSPLVEIAFVCLVIVGVVYLRIEPAGSLTTWHYRTVGAESSRTWASWWYLIVSLPIFQFIVLRWFWRYLLWCWLLWRVARLNLRLMPSHPDQMGGIAFIGELHLKLGVFTFAFELLPASLIAEEMLFAGAKIEAYHFLIPAYIAIGFIVLLAPLLLFSPKLVAARRAGMLAYSALGTEYARQFEQKWIRGQRAKGEHLLGSADIQSLADLGSNFQTVRSMSVVPFDIKMALVVIGVTAAVPFAPIAFIALPINEIVSQLAKAFF